VPDGDSFTAVSATITVPTVTGPVNANYSAYAWVGIDGWNGLNNLFQAGLDVRGVQEVDKSYYPQFRGYFEWYKRDPLFSEPDQLPLKSGDVLLVSINATSSTTGTVYLENRNTGLSFTHDSNEPDLPLTGRYAEWIVEEFVGNQVPSNAVFEFQSTLASTAGGKSFDASAASLVQVDDGRLRASFEGSDVKVASTS
jgi:hypothetical protein